MAGGNRPGGLTALAVINFVFGGLGIISSLVLFAVLKFADKAMQHASAADRQVFEALQGVGVGLFVFLIALSLIGSALLIASGIGYLKLKKGLGYWVGNVYAIISIITNVISAFIIPSEIGGGFGIGTLIGFLYPLITLGLLNTLFKEDFVN